MNIINNINAYNNAQWQNQGRDNNTHEYIAIHYLGVSNADNPNLYSVGSDTGFGGHFYVSIAGQAYQAAPVNAVIWHVGTGGCYKKRYPNSQDVTNKNCIGIEMGCIQDPDGVWRYTEETQETCVELVKYLMKTYGIPASHVLMHGEITTKICPACYIKFGGQKTNWTWEEFKSKITESKIDNTQGGVYMFSCETVKLGSSGNSVYLLQEILRARGYKGADGQPIVLDKQAGANTIYALKNLQKDRGLVVDGICGAKSWKAFIWL